MMCLWLKEVQHQDLNFWQFLTAEQGGVWLIFVCASVRDKYMCSELYTHSGECSNNGPPQSQEQRWFCDYFYVLKWETHYLAIAFAQGPLSDF